jgi:glycosyltransferase involved in cell wall biosynthesis
MRILQVVPRYAPAWAFGGGVRMTYELAKAWVQHGHQVTVFTSDQHEGGRQFAELEERLDGITIHRFKNPVNSLATRYPFLFFRPAGILNALGEIKDKFDIIHVAESRGPHNRWVARQAPRQQVPVAWSAYGGLATGEGLRRVYRKLHDQVFNTRNIVQRTNGFIAQTSHEAEVYRDFGAAPAQVRCIPLAVNRADFEKLPARGQFRQKLGLGDCQKLVVAMGRIHWTKGLQLLIPAFAEAVRQMPDVYLAVVGWDHGYLGQVQKMVAELGLRDRVLFPGPVYAADRLTVYVDADLFALTPEIFEETSLAALEACACGTGCVITRQCEIPGLDESNAGMTVEYEVGQISRALAVGLRDNMMQAWGANARRMVLDRFTTETVAQRHEQFFEELCDQRKLAKNSQ